MRLLDINQGLFYQIIFGNSFDTKTNRVKVLLFYC
jgi:hypothetical protein